MALKIPGIIVRIVNDTGIVAPPVYERYPVIIGEGDSYKIIENYKMTRSNVNHDIIPTTQTVNSIVSVGDLPGIAQYVAGVDYQLNGDRVEWFGPAGDEPSAGDNYFITWTETRSASAYVPTLYFDENLIYADHGNQTRIDGSMNDVAVGGSLALNAGANGVIIVQLDLSSAADPNNPTNSELETAFLASRNELEKITDYKLFLVPMSSGTLNTVSAANIMFNHAVLASQPENKQERTVIAALPTGTTYAQAATFAQSYAHERMVVPIAPNGDITVAGFSTAQDMRFGAATLAGKLCSVGIGRTITDEVLSNIVISDNFTPAEATYLVQRGVTPFKAKGDVTRVVLAITTDTTNALTEDLGVQDIKDYVKKYWREGLWLLYKNAPITTDTLNQIRSSSKGILEYLTSQSIVSEWKNITVSQSNVEPRQVNVTGKIKPAFSLQWMDVTFTFVLSF